MNIYQHRVLAARNWLGSLIKTANDHGCTHFVHFDSDIIPLSCLVVNDKEMLIVDGNSTTVIFSDEPGWDSLKYENIEDTINYFKRSFKLFKQIEVGIKK